MGEPRELLQDRLQIIFKYLTQKAKYKLIYANYRERFVEIIVQMAALSLEFAFENMLLTMVKGRHGPEMQVSFFFFF
jgi:hypothetical protein